MKLKSIMASGCIISFVLACLLVVPRASAQQPEKPAVTRGSTVEVVAQVEAIDKANRIVTVVGPQGNAVDIEAGDEVRNFDQIKVGDKVRVVYHESVAFYLAPPGSQPTANAAQVTGRAPKGEKPAGIVADTLNLSATVKAIDRKSRKLTLQLPDGRVVTTTVSPSVKAFDSVKVGDTIYAHMTRALAISVEEP